MKPDKRAKQNLSRTANYNSQTSQIQTMMSVVVGAQVYFHQTII